MSGRIDATRQTVGVLDELAAADPDPDPLLAFSTQVNGLIVAVHEGDVADALRRADRCTELLPHPRPGRDRQGDAAARPAGAGHQLPGLQRVGQVVRRRQHRRPAGVGPVAAAVTDRSGHGFTRAFAGVVEGLLAGMEGSPEWVADAMAWTTAVHDVDEYGLGTVWVGVLSAWAEGMRGDPAAAADRMRAGTERLDEIGARVCLTQYRAMLAELELAAEPAGRGAGGPPLTPSSARAVMASATGTPSSSGSSAVALARLGRSR